MEQIDYIYKDRSDFCVIALTGYTSAGCSRLAEYMANPDFLNLDEVRDPVSLSVNSPENVNNTDIYFNHTNSEISQSISQVVFKRKYSICHNFIKNRYKPYTIIKYSKVLLLMLLSRLCENSKNSQIFREKLISSIEDKYQPSTIHDEEYRKLKENSPWEDIDNLLKDLDLDGLYTELKNLTVPDLKKREKYDAFNKLTADIFLGRNGYDKFDSFYQDFNHRLFSSDYYSACFFYHRLGFQLRKTGDYEEKYAKVFASSGKFRFTYQVVKCINRIIKGIRFPLSRTPDNSDDNEESDSFTTEKNADERGCRIVIDSIRNSLEARYLKERHSAFYLIAVHDDENRAKLHLKEKLNFTYDIPEDQKDDKWEQSLEKEIDCIFSLGKTEQKKDQFEEGKFAAPNTEQCVADAEIHILNSDIEDKEAPFFQSMAEQWMKFASLILHPGLITPSSEERCMVVAYTAKFNSGCLSRQVGAVITNKAHSIRSIGWNDVPYGQVPCSLRSLYDFPQFSKDGAEKLKFIYSDFERGKNKYRSGFSFRKNVLIKYPGLKKHNYDSCLNGLPLPYCFKSLHNEFEDNKNQVHTRSLHAEENAILQIARFGGEGLENGVIYVTASPCELCCKKLYQIGVRKIIYIDEYPGISRQNIIAIGYKRPDLKQFQGAYGVTYFKLYQPIMSFKDELTLRMKQPTVSSPKSLSEFIKKNLDKDSTLQFSSPEELEETIELLKERFSKNESDSNSDPDSN